MSAIQEELNSLEQMGTWDVVDRREVPRDAKIMPSKFVLKVKRQADGTIDRFKARLVASGNLQQAGVDYDTTFAPVVDFTVVRMMLAIAAKKGFKVHQMDVKTAFFNGDVDADVHSKGCTEVAKFAISDGVYTD
jgi:hypothetical protein